MINMVYYRRASFSKRYHRFRPFPIVFTPTYITYMFCALRCVFSQLTRLANSIYRPISRSSWRRWDEIDEMSWDEITPTVNPLAPPRRGVPDRRTSSTTASKPTNLRARTRDEVGVRNLQFAHIIASRRRLHRLILEYTDIILYGC